MWCICVCLSSDRLGSAARSHTPRHHDDLALRRQVKNIVHNYFGCGRSRCARPPLTTPGPVQLADVRDRRADLQRGGLQRGHGHGVEAPERPRQELETRLQGVRRRALNMSWSRWRFSTAVWGLWGTSQKIRTCEEIRSVVVNF